jgi:hypothetical protein
LQQRNLEVWDDCELEVGSRPHEKVEGEPAETLARKVTRRKVRDPDASVDEVPFVNYPDEEAPEPTLWVGAVRLKDISLT